MSTADQQAPVNDAAKEPTADQMPDQETVNKFMQHCLDKLSLFLTQHGMPAEVAPGIAMVLLVLIFLLGLNIVRVLARHQSKPQQKTQ